MAGGPFRASGLARFAPKELGLMTEVAEADRAARQPFLKLDREGSVLLALGAPDPR
jgi:hypothetical protein